MIKVHVDGFGDIILRDNVKNAILADFFAEDDSEILAHRIETSKDSVIIEIDGVIVDDYGMHNTTYHFYCEDRSCAVKILREFRRTFYAGNEFENDFLNYVVNDCNAVFVDIYPAGCKFTNCKNFKIKDVA